MHRVRILHKTIFLELLWPFGLTILVFLAIFLMMRMLELTEYVVNYRVGLVPVVRLLLYSMPYFLTFVIPMAVLLAVILTFLRMSADSEVTAVRAGGGSLTFFLPPVMLFCLLATLLTAYMCVVGLVWGRLATKDLLLSVARRNIEIGIRERTFNDQFSGVVLYAGRVDPKKLLLHDVYIEDRKTPGVTTIIVAGRGKLFSEPEKNLWMLRLTDGLFNQVDDRAHIVHSGTFTTYDLMLDLKNMISPVRTSGPKDEEEMTIPELLDFIHTWPKRDDLYWLAKIQLQKKASIPFACMVMGFLAIPLGVVSRVSRKSFGVGLALGCFLLYYLILAAGEVFGEAGKYPPLIGMWMPNLVLFGIGLTLFVGEQNDRQVFAVRWAKAAAWRLRERRERRLGRAGTQE
ncbi:MAG: LPS export ABC transporter permease LptF [Thermodesulfobacteriota bacterium]